MQRWLPLLQRLTKPTRPGILKHGETINQQ
jgi:hypothetical protein